MVADGRAIANFILDEAQRSNHPVTNLALQKLVFFCHAWHLVETGEPLVKHSFEAWQHGPVLQYLYSQFKEFDEHPITSRAKRLNRFTGVSEEVKDQLDNNTKERLRRVLNFYGRMRPWDLRELSHEPGGPWDKVYNHSGKVNPGMKIDNMLIRSFYSSMTPLNEVQ